MSTETIQAGDTADQPAFPFVNTTDGFTAVSSGMTLRQYYAGQAMIGLLANPETNRLLKNIQESGRHQSIAETAVKAADQLIAELSKPLKP